MSTRTALTLTLAALTMLCSCRRETYAPKPTAYMRFELPKHEYCHLDTMIAAATKRPLPFMFESNKIIEWREKDAPAGERWVDLMYPQWDGVIFLTYRRLASPDSLRSQMDESLRYLEHQYRFSSGVEEKGYEDPDNHVYGTVNYIKGSRVASTCQFWLTDSSDHFLRGALYLNRVPNNDSMAPVIDYMQADIRHMVETLRWTD